MCDIQHTDTAREDTLDEAFDRKKQWSWTGLCASPIQDGLRCKVTLGKRIYPYNGYIVVHTFVIYR